MAGDQSISWLMFFTFGAAIFIIAGSCIYFLQRRTNREIASDALVGDGSATSSIRQDGALPDLLAIGLFALIAMGLLTGGYMSKSHVETDKLMPAVGSPMPTDRK